MSSVILQAPRPKSNASPWLVSSSTGVMLRLARARPSRRARKGGRSRADRRARGTDVHHSAPPNVSAPETAQDGRYNRASARSTTSRWAARKQRRWCDRRAFSVHRRRSHVLGGHRRHPSNWGSVVCLAEWRAVQTARSCLGLGFASRWARRLCAALFARRISNTRGWRPRRGSPHRSIRARSVRRSIRAWTPWLAFALGLQSVDRRGRRHRPGSLRVATLGLGPAR